MYLSTWFLKEIGVSSTFTIKKSFKIGKSEKLQYKRDLTIFFRKSKNMFIVQGSLESKKLAVDLLCQKICQIAKDAPQCYCYIAFHCSRLTKQKTQQWIRKKVVIPDIDQHCYSSSVHCRELSISYSTPLLECYKDLITACQLSLEQQNQFSYYWQMEKWRN